MEQVELFQEAPQGDPDVYCEQLRMDSIRSNGEQYATILNYVNTLADIDAAPAGSDVKKTLM